jgi:hypothetical protein
MSAPVVVIGYIFLIPSILGVLAGCLLLFLSAGASDSGSSMFIVGGFAVTVIVSAFVGGLLGWLLVMKKRVLECENCGAIVPAS